MTATWNPSDPVLLSETTEIDTTAEMWIEAERIAVAARAAEEEEATPSEEPIGRTAPSDETFPQSVASGGPTPSGVIVWTRISPEAYREGEPMFVEIARDEAFEDIVFSGAIHAESIDPEHDYTVKLDLDGSLGSDAHYYYRFVYAGVESQHGRCRTLPDEGENVDRIAFGVVTCQDYQNGYFGAFSRLAQEDIDYIVHLGDFIYETAAHQYAGLGSQHYPDRTIELPSGHDIVWSLDDFREMYRIYRSDSHLQRALENHTLIRGWDDHAVANNRYWDYENDFPRVPNHPRGNDPEFATQLTLDGIQTWWEYTPARVEYHPEERHPHRHFRLYRQYRFGDLVTFVMTDERLYRDGPPCRDSPLPNWLPSCRETADPDRTMLGDDQLEWFLERIRESETTWTAWGNEVLTVNLKIGFGPLSLSPMRDGWDGYEYERKQISTELAKQDIENFVTVTGDMHSAVASYQLAEYSTPADRSGENEVDRVGVEFMTSAVTSVNLSEAMGLNRLPLSDELSRLLSDVIRTCNPYIRFFDSTSWGYSVVEFTPEECVYTAISVDKTANDSNLERSIIGRFRVPHGSVEIEDVAV